MQLYSFKDSFLMANLFEKIKKGVSTATSEKKEAPDGLWFKCPRCKHTVTRQDLEDNLYVCEKCNYHNRINAEEYFKFLFDNGKYEELFTNIAPKDYLGFTDLKAYRSEEHTSELQSRG